MQIFIMKIIAIIQILIKLFTIGYGASAVRTTGRFAAPAAAGNSLAQWLRTAPESFIFSTSYLYITAIYCNHLHHIYCVLPIAVLCCVYTD